MPRFSERTIALVRRNVEEMLTDRCQIRRANAGVDDYGYPTQPPMMVAADVPCRVLPYKRQGREMSAEQEMGRSYFRLVLAYDVDLRDGDQVDVGDVLYEVTQIDNARTDAADLQATMVRVWGNDGT